MEAILRSVLLRQEQMAMQWDAEFEQQKHLFHVNTSTLMDMLPIRPRKKRLRVEGRVQAGPIASHDKENLVGFQEFLPSSACARSPKTEAPQSRGLAKRDLNTRFCDHDVKHAGRMHSKPAAAEPPVVRSALVEGPNAENVQQSGRVACAVVGSNPVSLGVSVKVEVDEGASRWMRVSPPTDETSSSPGERRKRARGKEEGASVVWTCDGEDKQVSNDAEGGAMGAERPAAGEKKNKPKKARVVGEAEENAVGVQTCSVAQISPSSELEIVIKVEAVEAEERSCRDGEAVDATQPEVARRGPARRGRAKGASAASRAAGEAAVADIVSKEPGRRGRAKKAPTASGAAEPEIAQRVTRSRARKVESVVESEADACERMSATQVAGKESGEEKEKVAADVSHNVEDPCSGVGNCEAKQGELAADCDGGDEGGSAKQIVAGQMDDFCERKVCAAPSGGVPADEASMTKAAESKERKSIARSRKEHCENNSVAGDMGKAGRRKVIPHAESQEGAACLNAGGEEQSARIASRAAEILASAVKAGDVKGVGLESRPRSGLGRIEQNVGHSEAEFEHSLASMPEGTWVQGRCVPLAPCEAPPAEKETAKNARFAASATDTLVREDSVERTKEVARMQVKVTGDRRQAGKKRALRSSAAQRRSPGEAAVALLGGDPMPGSGGTSMKEVSRAMPANTGEAYTALLGQVIEGSTLASAKSGASVSTPESVIVARPRNSSLRTGGAGESVAVALEIAGAGGDASASEVEFLPTEVVTRKSTAADGSVDGRGASGEQAVEDPIALFCEGRAAESENVLENAGGMEANIELAERSWQTKEECVQDVVAKCTWDGSRVKEAENARQSMDGASLVDASGGEQVESHAVTPSRFSEARSIQEAMRCSLEQEFHPEVTETLNRWQFRRRLSPRSKARARRWRSDVATNGVDYGRGQSSDAPVASPSRAVSSRDRSLESAAYETFVEAQSPYPEDALAGVEPGFSSDAEKAVDEAHTSWQVRWWASVKHGCVGC